MKYYFIGILSGAGLLCSCSTSKLKTKHSVQEVISLQRDSVGSESNWRSFEWAGSSAHELLIRYRGNDRRLVAELDSGSKTLALNDRLQQVKNTETREKQKDTKHLFGLPWWAYLALVPLGYFLGRRLCQ